MAMNDRGAVDLVEDEDDERPDADDITDEHVIDELGRIADELDIADDDAPATPKQCREIAQRIRRCMEIV